MIRIASVLALIFSSLPCAALPTVMSGPVNFGGKTYYLLTNSNWTDAEQTAVSMGGHLVSVNSQAENDFIQTTFGADDRNLLIGFTDANVEGTFEWVSGEPVTFTNWYTGGPVQPDNAGYSGNEDYTTMFWPSGQWNDIADDPANVFPNHGVVEVPEPAFAVGFLVAMPLLQYRSVAKVRSRKNHQFVPYSFGKH